MKKINLIWGILFLLLLATSCKKINQKATIKRDTCGEYLIWDEKYYSICNPEKISAYSTNEQITVTFKKVKKCETYPTYPNCLTLSMKKTPIIEILEIK